MAITTFSELKTAIQTWMDRTDISGNAADFITLAEGHLNRKLRVREMQAVAELTPSSGVCDLPSDYLQQRRVVALTSPVRQLSFISPSAADEIHDRAIVAPSQSFSVIGQKLYTYPLSAQNIELTYYQSLPALSDSQTTNWLLSKFPDLYLEASMMQACRFVRDDANLAISAAFVKEMINDLNDEANMSEMSAAGRTNRGVTP